MKKYLLVLMLVMLTVCITNAQTQGHSWRFNSLPPYTSTPAMVGSTGSHTLALLGDGASAITVVNEPVALGTSCAGSIDVVKYGGPPPPLELFGLQFNNDPQFVTNVYTIEMTVKFDATGNFHKLIGFTDLSDPADASPSDFGIYITPDGAGAGNNVLFFYSSNTPPTGYYMVGPSKITQNTWHHLTVVRDANKIITCYLNGVRQGSFNDSGDDFLPKPGPTPGGNNNAISFFKDNGTQEISGSIARLSIYNRVLTESEIAKKIFNNICSDPSFQLPVTPDEGHQWKFSTATAPFVSVPALAESLGNYTLEDTVTGTGAIVGSTSDDLAGLGASCAGPVSDIASFSQEAGLVFDNSPRYVYDTYTIELAINLGPSVGGEDRRLVGFHSSSEYGIYLRPDGRIAFFNGVNTLLTPQASLLADNTWCHLVFTRSADEVITCYLNGTLIGTYPDTNGDFIPQSSNLNRIIFLKDNDNLEETSGQLAKIGVFNVAMIPSDVLERYNNICNTNLVVLPVSLKSFTAVKADNQVQLTWITSSEQNNLGFEVQRSSDGINFTGIGFVNGNGTTTQENTYHFTDPSPFSGKNYYRLKQVDIDNRASYSSIRRIDMDKERQSIQLFPNPSRSLITITNIKAGDQMSVFNSLGNLILRKIASSGQEAISVEKFAAGVYMLQVTDSDNNKRTIRFSKF